MTGHHHGRCARRSLPGRLERNGWLLVAVPTVGAGRAAAQAPAATPDTVTVVARTLDKTVAIPGDLTAYQSVNVHAKVAGFGESVAVDRGSWVQRAQVLARLSAPELRAQRAEAEAKVRAVKAQLAEAQARMVSVQATYQRLKAASATPGVVAGNDLEVAERGVDAARAHVDALTGSVLAAEASLTAVAELERSLEITAPFDGVITERNVHPGSLVNQSSGPMLRIEQIARLRLTVPVPEVYVGAISRGVRVAFSVSAYPDRTFQGVVARPAHSLDMKTRSMPVELDVTNTTRALAPGMFAEVEWPVSRGHASLFVPATAVVRTSERQFAVRVRNGVAEWADVRRGETTGDLIEVFSELREGDLVIRRGNDEIRPGPRIGARAGRR